MTWLNAALLLTAAYPLLRAGFANRRTTLLSSVVWAGFAWVAWLVVLYLRASDAPTYLPTARYLALSLTGCAGVAVLGARRPGVGAWNFVTAGLLSVLLLPLAFGWGKPRLETLHVLFLGVTLAIGILNYLPTRLGLGALLLGLSCSLHFLQVLGSSLEEPLPLWMGAAAGWSLALSPWVTFLSVACRGIRGEEVDRWWLEFRDSYGVVWGRRLCEQFNRSMENNHCPVHLSWHGLTPTGDGEPDRKLVVMTMQALLKRFV